MKYTLVLVACMTAAAVSAAGQTSKPRTAGSKGPASTAQYVPAEKVAAALKDGTRIAAGSDFIALGAKRTGPGQVEVHEKETDTFYVLDGEATFITGGTMIGGKLARPHQWYGTSIEGGETHHLKKGDFVTIPAGIPHWFKEVPASINYYVIKVVKP